MESVVLGGAKSFLGCSSKTCNGAVRGDMGLESFQCHRVKAKLKWWYKLACMEGDRYPHKQNMELGRIGILYHVEVTKGNLGVG